MKFDWDADKNERNISEHGIDFNDAKVVFVGAGLEKIDDRQDYGEERWIRLGWMKDIPIYVVFTRRSGVIRIISARMAEEAEEMQLVSLVEGERVIQQGNWEQRKILDQKKQQKSERIKSQWDQQEK